MQNTPGVPSQALRVARIVDASWARRAQ